jgi:hypothetical protein
VNAAALPRDDHAAVMSTRKGLKVQEIQPSPVHIVQPCKAEVHLWRRRERGHESSRAQMLLRSTSSRMGARRHGQAQGEDRAVKFAETRVLHVW